MEKILLTYATRPLGLRVANMLNGAFQVEKCSSDEIPSVLQASYATIPQGNSSVYAHELLKLALDKGCTYVVPLGIDEIRTVAEAWTLFEEYGIQLVCPRQELLGEVNILIDPAPGIDLHLICKSKDLLTGEPFESAEWDGLCLVSDSCDEFILAVV